MLGIIETGAIAVVDNTTAQHSSGIEALLRTSCHQPHLQIRANALLRLIIHSKLCYPQENIIIQLKWSRHAEVVIKFYNIRKEYWNNAESTNQLKTLKNFVSSLSLTLTCNFVTAVPSLYFIFDVSAYNILHFDLNSKYYYIYIINGLKVVKIMC